MVVYESHREFLCRPVDVAGVAEVASRTVDDVLEVGAGRQEERRHLGLQGHRLLTDAVDGSVHVTPVDEVVLVQALVNTWTRKDIGLKSYVDEEYGYFTL